MVVFIPAWNEQDNLPAVLDELREGLPDADVLVIDDGSTDATAQVARAHGADVVSFGENRGLRIGIATGYREAAERGYAFCGRVDADGQHPVPELRAPARDSCAPAPATSRSARASPRARATRTTATGRAPPGASASACCRPACGCGSAVAFHDPGSGMVAANARAMPVMGVPYTSGAPEVEALMRLHADGLRVEEVAVEMRARASGESRLRGRKAVKLVITVAATLLFFRWMNRRR